MSTKKYPVEYIEKDVGETRFSFECQTIDTDDGFRHEVTLRKNLDVVAFEKKLYYNRTWESYQYQSAMLGAVHNAMAYLTSTAVDMYKTDNGIKRLTKEKRQAVVEAVHKTKEWNELHILEDMVENARYGTENERKRLEALDGLLNLAEAMASAGFFGHEPKGKEAV